MGKTLCEFRASRPLDAYTSARRRAKLAGGCQSSPHSLRDVGIKPAYA